MPKASSVPPPLDCGKILPRHDFADAFRVDNAKNLDAPEATRRAFSNAPTWAARLMALRDRIVAPFGLKPAPASGFPVISETPGQVVLGFDDRHLDFRIVVSADQNFITLTTIVRRHNLLGRAYLAAIMPFHRKIAAAFAEAI